MEVISPLLYRLAICNREYVKHHDKLHIHKDRDIPLRARWKRHLTLTTPGPTTDVAVDDELLDGIGVLFSHNQTTVDDQVTMVLEEERTLVKTTRLGHKITHPSRYSDKIY